MKTFICNLLRRVRFYTEYGASIQYTNLERLFPAVPRIHNTESASLLGRKQHATLELRPRLARSYTIATLETTAAAVAPFPGLNISILQRVVNTRNSRTAAGDHRRICSYRRSFDALLPIGLSVGLLAPPQPRKPARGRYVRRMQG